MLRSGYVNGVFYVVRAATVAMHRRVNILLRQQRGCVFCVVRAEELS
jgi:hypothetical protein